MLITQELIPDHIPDLSTGLEQDRDQDHPKILTGAIVEIAETAAIVETAAIAARETDVATTGGTKESAINLT